MHASKTPEKESSREGRNDNQSRANPVPALVDNRPEGVAQRSLQDLVNNSPRVAQLRAAQELANNSTTGSASQSTRSLIQRQPMEKADGAAAARATGGAAGGAGGQPVPVHAARALPPAYAMPAGGAAAAAGAHHAGAAAAGPIAGQAGHAAPALPRGPMSHAISFLAQPELGAMAGTNKRNHETAHNAANIMRLYGPKIKAAKERIERGQRMAYEVMHGNADTHRLLRREIAEDIIGGIDTLTEIVQMIRLSCSHEISKGSPLEKELNGLTELAEEADITRQLYMSFAFGHQE